MSCSVEIAGEELQAFAVGSEVDICCQFCIDTKMQVLVHTVHECSQFLGSTYLYQFCRVILRSSGDAYVAELDSGSLATQVKSQEIALGSPIEVLASIGDVHVGHTPFISLSVSQTVIKVLLSSACYGREEEFHQFGQACVTLVFQYDISLVVLQVSGKRSQLEEGVSALGDNGHDTILSIGDGYLILRFGGMRQIDILCISI